MTLAEYDEKPKKKKDISHSTPVFNKTAPKGCTERFCGTKVTGFQKKPEIWLTSATAVLFNSKDDKFSGFINGNKPLNTNNLLQLRKMALFMSRVALDIKPLLFIEKSVLLDDRAALQPGKSGNSLFSANAEV